MGKGKTVNKNKEKKEEILGLITVIILLIISFFIGYTVAIHKDNSIYEFAKDGKVYGSNNCYVKDDIPYCEYKCKFVDVDNYYKVER